jgi:hypothetical protein
MKVEDNPLVGVLRFKNGEFNFFAHEKYRFLDSRPHNLIVSKVFGAYIKSKIPSCVSL